MPNAPQFKKGPPKNLQGFDKRDFLTKAALAHEEALMAALTSLKDVAVVKCTGLFDSASVPEQSTRSLCFDFLLLISSTKAKNDQGEIIGWDCRWGKSKLFRRRSFHKQVQMMPRRIYACWHAAIASVDSGNKDSMQEMKQWLSGYDLYGALLDSLLAGSNISSLTRVQVRDMTMYDCELACAVMNHNAAVQAVQLSSRPVMAYVGVAWCDEDGTTGIIAANVREAMVEQLMARSKDNTYSLFKGKMPSIPMPSINEGQAPKLCEELYEVTRPRDMELPIRQAAYDIWGSKTIATVHGHTFADIVKIHDSEFNPTGTPFKEGLKRAIGGQDASAVQQSSCPPVELPVKSDDPATQAELLETQGGSAVPSNSKDFSFVVTQEGALWMVGVADCIVPTDEVLFLLRGSFKKGEACTALQSKEKDGAWVPFALAPDSLVCVTFTTPLQKGDWTVTPAPLEDFIVYMEALGHVKIDIKLHTYTKMPEDPKKIKVAVTEPSLLQLEVIEGHLCTELTVVYVVSWKENPACY